MARRNELCSNLFFNERATIPEEGMARPGRFELPDPLIRSQVLYPAELRAHARWRGNSHQ